MSDNTALKWIRKIEGNRQIVWNGLILHEKKEKIII